MDKLLSLIKTAGADAVNASNPVNIMYGEVISTNPLEIKAGQKLLLPSEVLDIPESLTKYEISLTHSHTYADGTTGESLSTIIIRPGMQPGDTVILLRMQGGQRFIVLDRVVDT